MRDEVTAAAIRLIGPLLLAGSLLGCASPQPGGESGPGGRDRVMETRVKAALTEVLGLAAAAIGVEADDGVVTLTGFTASGAERDRAAATTRGMEGVHRVIDRIRVKR